MRDYRERVSNGLGWVVSFVMFLFVLLGAAAAKSEELPASEVRAAVQLWWSAKKLPFIKMPHKVTLSKHDEGSCVLAYHVPGVEHVATLTLPCTTYDAFMRHIIGPRA